MGSSLSPDPSRGSQLRDLKDEEDSEEEEAARDSQMHYMLNKLYDETHDSLEHMTFDDVD